MAGEYLMHAVRWIRGITVEPVLFLYMFASSLTYSAYQAMIYDKSCLTLYNQTLCDELNTNKSAARQHNQETDAIQTLTSAWIMYGNIAVTVPATVVLLLCLGSCGDRLGRRVPLMVPCVSAMAYSISNILNAHYMTSPLAYTLVGPIFSGLGGSYLAVLMASYTYLTHLVNKGNRMMRVGMAESAVFLSSTVSVFVSGLLVDNLGYLPTFGLILAFQTMALLYTVVLLPDLKSRRIDTTSIMTPTTPIISSSEDDGRVSCCQEAWYLNPLQDMWCFFRTPRATRVIVHLTLLIVVLDILQLCTTGELDILLLYLKRSPRNWTYTTYGNFKGAENFTRGAAVLLLLPLLKKLASPKDTTLILAGLVSKIGGLVLLGLATQTWTVFLVVGVACLQGFPSAGLRSLMSSLVEREEQGRLFGLVATTESVVSFTSTLIFNGLYPLTLAFYDGFCLQLAAGLVFICFIIVVYQHVDFNAADGPIFQRFLESPSSSAASDTSSQVDSTHTLQPGHSNEGFSVYGSADPALGQPISGTSRIQRTDGGHDETDFGK